MTIFYLKLILPIPLHLSDFVHLSNSAYFLYEEGVPMKLAHIYFSSLVCSTHFSTSLFSSCFIHCKYLLSIYYVPGPKLGLGDSVVNKTYFLPIRSLVANGGNRLVNVLLWLKWK